jgi:hypothetical protein
MERDDQKSNSLLLLQHGIGHFSLSHPIPCVTDALKYYLDNGHLPLKETVCDKTIDFSHIPEELFL